MAVDRLRERYPDKEFNDDEAIFGQISDDYDELDNQLGEYKKREGEIVDMFSSNPMSANFFANWHNGSSPEVELMRQFGDLFREALDDPDKLDELEAAHKEYLERVAKSKELQEQYEQNIEASREEKARFQADHGLSDEETDAVMDRLNKIFQNGIIGIFEREDMELLLKGVNHDEDVTSAADDAEVRGRNAKINETLRKRQEGDGVAAMGGAAGKVRPEKRANSIFDVANGAN